MKAELYFYLFKKSFELCRGRFCLSLQYIILLIDSILK